MGRLEPILRRALAGPCRVRPGSRLLIAVSGGADSTALCLGLARLARELGLELHAAHLHHGLRGADADGDREFVRALCERLAIPFHSARWDTRRRMRERGLAGQAGLRRLRREFLARIARRIGATWIATAHTADDQLETVLLRLLRGTGLPGLGAMRPRCGAWIKPLLEATRADVEDDLGDARQPWREDRSNQDPAYARNRVRHVVIPALVGALGGVRDARKARARLAGRVGRTAREAAESERALRAWVRPVLGDPRRIQGGQIDLDSSRVRSYPVASRRTLWRMSWKYLVPAGPGLTHHHLRALDRLVHGTRGGAQIALPGGAIATRDRGRVRIRTGESVPPSGPIRLAVPGLGRWGDRALRGRWISGAGALDRLPLKSRVEEYFAAEHLEGTLEVRAGRADEEFVPFGRRKPVRLVDFLRKQDIARDPRSGPGVLADSGGILWVIGVRRSARAPVTPGTRRALWVLAE